MIEFIIGIIFIVSFGGALFILARKIPVLTALPQNGSTGIKKYQIISNTENKIKNILVSFEKQIYLHKFLSFVKVMTLKIETKVDSSLRELRKKAQQVDKELKEKK